MTIVFCRWWFHYTFFGCATIVRIIISTIIFVWWLLLHRWCWFHWCFWWLRCRCIWWIQFTEEFFWNLLPNAQSKWSLKIITGRKIRKVIKWYEVNEMCFEYIYFFKIIMLFDFNSPRKSKHVHLNRWIHVFVHTNSDLHHYCTPHQTDNDWYHHILSSMIRKTASLAYLNQQNWIVKMSLS